MPKYICRGQSIEHGGENGVVAIFRGEEVNPKDFPEEVFALWLSRGTVEKLEEPVAKPAAKSASKPAAKSASGGK